MRVCPASEAVGAGRAGNYRSHRIYLENGCLNVVTLGRGCAWPDTGPVDPLTEAAEFVKVIETRQGVKMAALEEISCKNGWITCEQLQAAAELYGSAYGAHLRRVAEGEQIC